MVFKMRISILSNVNLDMLSGLLKKENEIFQTDGYGEWITYALRPDKQLTAFAPECILLLLEGNELLKNCTDIRGMREELDQVKAYVKRLAENYPNSYLLVSTIDVCGERVRSRDTGDCGLAAAVYWDNLLTELVESYGNLHRFELRRLIEDYGRKNFYSSRFWYMGSIPYDMKALHTLSAEIQLVLGKLKPIRRKVLVLDLDNTLWGGVIGEDGMEGIQLDSAHQGAIYQDAQREIKKMQQQGVLLAIASKNNIEDVQNVLREHPHMILKESDFVAIYADWNPKWENIRKMAAELNLGLDAFVFVDDNEAEREGMKIHVPEVAVVDFPTDVSALADCMRQVYEQYFWSWKLTEEDKEKTAQYQQEKKRQDEKKAAVSYEDYLKSLETKIRLAEVSDETRNRAVQLMNKTNQFNVCTLRMDELELDKYLKEKQGHLLMAEVSDKYGNSGWVAEILYHLEGQTAVVDNFLMSCRVMGRLIEDAIVATVFEKLAEQGVSEVRAVYIKSAKNKPVEELWDKLGFVRIGGDDARKEYSLSMEAYQQIEKKEMLHTVMWS